MNLKQMIESDNTKAGRRFDLFIQSIIVLSIISHTLDTIDSIVLRYGKILYLVEIITIGIFTIEYLARLIVASNKFKYIFSFFGLIDLFAILPFYVMSGLDLRSLRVFRLLRVFRALKLLGYNKAIRRFHRAFVIMREELFLYLFVTAMLLYLSAAGVYHFEHVAQPEKFGSILDGLWWAVATLTTVGYGDIYPITIGGKIFTFAILMIGLGIVAVPAGLLSSALSQARREETESRDGVN